MPLNVLRFAEPLRYADAYAKQIQLAEVLRAAPGRDAKLMLLQHTPVYTLGRMTKAAHLPQREELARTSGAEVAEADRGGSVTWHGPGQLTAYLIIHLKSWGLDIHRHLWNLEEAAIRCLRAFGLEGRRVEGMTGVWTGGAKICAIGVGCRRWVTYHGLALNVDPDLRAFDKIDPCGLGRKPVTSLARELKRGVTMQEAEVALVAAFETILED